MALYIARFTVPPNTPETNPVEVKLTVEGRFLEKIEYRFPAGVFESVGVAVFYGNRRISPKGKEKWVRGENEKVVDPIEWDLPARRCTLTIRAWSEAEDFDHTITVRFIVKPYRPITVLEQMRQMLHGLAERFRLIFGV